MNLLLCTAPTSSVGDSQGPPDPSVRRPFFTINFGITSIICWLEKNGYSRDDIDFYDFANLRPRDETIISYLKRYKPTVVGISAPMSHCYLNVKCLIKIIRDLFPDIWILVGGHITSSAHVILKKTGADICVVGDGEIAMLHLLKYFEKYQTNKELNFSRLKEISGIAYLNKDKTFQLTGFGEQLTANELDLPDIELLKLGLKGQPEWIEYFLREGFPVDEESIVETPKVGKVLLLPASKGCVARCTFCQRYTKGYRVISIEKIEKYIMNFKEKFDIGGVILMDECFGSKKRHSYEFARLLKKYGLIWYIAGVRCKSTTLEDLKFYKENGLYSVKYGIESGSKQILEVMEKNYHPGDVLIAIRNCINLGIQVDVNAFMLGMPGETPETVKQSAAFHAELRFITGKNSDLSPSFWASAVPGTPLYEYCQQIGIIGKNLDAEEKYLRRLDSTRADFPNYINKTEFKFEEILFWGSLYSLSGKKTYRNLVLKANISFFEKIEQFYKGCIISELRWYSMALKSVFPNKVPFNLRSILNQLLMTSNFTIGLQVRLFNLFVPQSILFPIVKLWVRSKYKIKEKTLLKYRTSATRLFTYRNFNQKKELMITNLRLRNLSRPIQRSLRRLVADNRMKISEETSEHHWKRKPGDFEDSPRDCPNPDP